MPLSQSSNPSTQRFQFTVLNGPQSGVVFLLEIGHHFIGRDPDNQIQLADDWVSGRHALIEVGHEGIWIKDLGSANNTLVDGRRVIGRMRLHSGALLQIGTNVVLRLEVATPSTNVPVTVHGPQTDPTIVPPPELNGKEDPAIQAPQSAPPTRHDFGPPPVNQTQISFKEPPKRNRWMIATIALCGVLLSVGAFFLFSRGPRIADRIQPQENDSAYPSIQPTALPPTQMPEGKPRQPAMPVETEQLLTVVVPDVIGVELDQARQAIKKLGLTVEVYASQEIEIHGPEPEYLVEEQEPQSGSMLQPGELVRIGVPRGIRTDIPYISEVNIRNDVSNGQRVIYQDILYYDWNGDAEVIDFEIISTTNENIFTEDGQVEHSKVEQQEGATLTGTWNCGAETYTVVLEVAIWDKAGNQSNAVEFTMECK